MIGNFGEIVKLIGFSFKSVYQFKGLISWDGGLIFFNVLHVFRLPGSQGDVTDVTGRLHVDSSVKNVI